MKKLKPGKEDNGKFFVWTYMQIRIHELAALSSELQCCVLNKICWTLSRESGIFGPDKRRRFHRLSEDEYFYGTPLRGQEFCWEIKVNLVTGNAVLRMWEQMTEAMCYNLVKSRS